MSGRLSDAGATARVETETGDAEADFADLSTPAARRFLWRDSEAVYVAHYPLAPVRLSGGSFLRAILYAPNASLNVADLNAAWEDANKDSSRANLNRVIIELIKTKNNLALLTEQVQERRKSLSERYRTQSDSVAMTTFLLGMLGLGLLGAIIGLFFRRLTDDLRTLQSRALEIVKGFRGIPIAITRHDEVGQLMIAVNNMAETLDRRDRSGRCDRKPAGGRAVDTASHRFEVRRFQKDENRKQAGKKPARRQ